MKFLTKIVSFSLLTFCLQANAAYFKPGTDGFVTACQRKDLSTAFVKTDFKKTYGTGTDICTPATVTGVRAIQAFVQDPANFNSAARIFQGTNYDDFVDNFGSDYGYLLNNPAIFPINYLRIAKNQQAAMAGATRTGAATDMRTLRTALVTMKQFSDAAPSKTLGQVTTSIAAIPTSMGMQTVLNQLLNNVQAFVARGATGGGTAASLDANILGAARNLQTKLSGALTECNGLFSGTGSVNLAEFATAVDATATVVHTLWLGTGLNGDAATLANGLRAARMIQVNSYARELVDATPGSFGFTGLPAGVYPGAVMVRGIHGVAPLSVFNTGGAIDPQQVGNFFRSCLEGTLALQTLAGIAAPVATMQELITQSVRAITARMGAAVPAAGPAVATANLKAYHNETVKLLAKSLIPIKNDIIERALKATEAFGPASVNILKADGTYGKNVGDRDIDGSVKAKFSITEETYPTDKDDLIAMIKQAGTANIVRNVPLINHLNAQAATLGAGARKIQFYRDGRPGDAITAPLLEAAIATDKNLTWDVIVQR